MSSLNLTYNRLTGSIPAAGSDFVEISCRAAIQKGAANVVLSPMKTGTGLCGPIAGNMNITDSTSSPLLHQMPGGPCPGQQNAQVVLQVPVQICEVQLRTQSTYNSNVARHAPAQVDGVLGVNAVQILAVLC